MIGRRSHPRVGGETESSCQTGAPVEGDTASAAYWAA